MYNHHETCGICHTSSPCEHTLKKITDDFNAWKTRPVKVNISLDISRKLTDISLEIDRNTVNPSKYELLTKLVNEAVLELQNKIERQVFGKLRSMCTHVYPVAINEEDKPQDIEHCIYCGLKITDFEKIIKGI